ncbi:anti-sigma factor domain-containing protein [Kribbella sp. NPDC051587]|uniref:anti-sigma factor n=1 Tax=Kribbella sp. NPDC051587 TaxID=3364119 RepID=UPI003787D279
MTTPDVHALTGPYVLDALPDDERVSFELHLAECESCAIEIDELRGAAIKLAGQVSTAPPPALRASVLAAIDHVRQLPPLVPELEPSVIPPYRRFGRRSMLTLAAAALAAVTSGGIALDQYRKSATSQRAADRIADVLADPAARTVRSAVAGGGQATVVTSRTADSAVVALHGIRKLPSDQTWQLWLVDDAQLAHSVGLVPGDSGRDVTRVISGGLTGKITFGLTVEPAGGSGRPTLPAAAMISL